MFMHSNTAAWIYDGFITFYLDTVNKGRDYWGSSLDKKHWDVAKSNLTSVNVTCLSIASILARYTPNDYVVLKMDVEGAEYTLLMDFIVKDVMRLIDLITVEFHPTLNPWPTVESTYAQLFKTLGTRSFKWA